MGSDTIIVEFEECTGIGELKGISNISLYPNHGQGEFSLKLDSHIPVELSIKVYNNNGISVYEGENVRVSGSELMRIDLSDQPSGIYLVNIYNQTGKWIEKLIISK